MRKLKFVTMLAAGCGLALSTAPSSQAQTVLTVNPDGSVSQVETASPGVAGSRSFQSGLRTPSGAPPRLTTPTWRSAPSRLGRHGRTRDGVRYGRDGQGNIIIIGDNTDVYIDNRPYPGYYTGYPGHGYGYPRYGVPGYGSPYGSTTSIYIGGGLPGGYYYGNPRGGYIGGAPYSVYAPGVVGPPYPSLGHSYGLPYGNYNGTTTTTYGGLTGGISIGGGHTHFSIGGGRHTTTTTTTVRTFP